MSGEDRMAAALSGDLRGRIVAAVEGGSSVRQAAARFAVSPSAAVKLMRRVRETGSAAPGRVGGHRAPVLAPHEAFLRSLAASKPGVTLREMQAGLRLRGAEVAALSTIHRTLVRFGPRHKKSR
jgi:putative transposase